MKLLGWAHVTWWFSFSWSLSFRARLIHVAAFKVAVRSESTIGPIYFASLDAIVYTSPKWENEPPQKVPEMRRYSKVVFGMRMGGAPIHIERINFE